MKRYRLGFIGGSCESIAGYPHYIASRMDGHFDVVAGAFSTHPDINRKTGERWGVPNIYADWRELLEKERTSVDAVVILVPTPLHSEIVVAALEAGYPIICEKPLAGSMEEMQTIAKAYDPSRHFLVVTNNYSGYPMVRELRQRIAQEEFGDIHVLRLEMPQESFLRPPKSIKYPQKWRLKDGFVPMIAFDLGTHLYHLASFLLNVVPTAVWAEMNSFSSYPVIDDMVIQARYPSAMQANFWMSKVALGNRNGLCLKVYGSRGSAVWQQETPERLEIAHTDGSKCIIDRGGEMQVASNPLFNRMTPGHPAGFIEAFANLYHDIYAGLDNFLTGKNAPSPYVYGFDHSLEAMRFLHNARRSCDQGGWVENN